MKDRYHKKANVLGIDVSVMRVDKAVNVSMELMRGKGLPVIYFLSAISSLLCQNNEQSAEYVKSCNLILAGDRHIEMAVHHRQDNGQIPEGIGEFADNYLKRLFSKINREGRSIYMVMEQESYLESMEEYMEESYRNIEVHGNVMRKETKGEADRIVNEINACIPDIVFVCIPAERQMKFMEKHAAMMNTRLCILIESVQPLIRKETEEIPSWVEKLHLEGIYSWFKKEQKAENIEKGKDLIEKEVKRIGFSHSDLFKTEYIEPMLEKYRYKSLEEMYAAVGFGANSAVKIIARMLQEYRKEHQEINVEEKIQELSKDQKDRKARAAAASSGVVVKGIDNCLVKLSKCCNPLPGDEIVGYITKGRGVSVHRKDCVNVKDLLTEENRMIDVEWYKEAKESYQVEIEVLANDRSGLLVDILNVLKDTKAKLMGVNTRTTKERIAIMDISIEIDNLEELNKVQKVIRKVDSVYEVRRKR